MLAPDYKKLSIVNGKILTLKEIQFGYGKAREIKEELFICMKH